jgi:hypothetical protein
MKASELLKKLADVPFSDQQLGDGKTPVLRADFWNHGLTPPHVFLKHVA